MFYFASGYIGRYILRPFTSLPKNMRGYEPSDGRLSYSSTDR